MNPLIEKELQKVKYASLPQYSQDTTEIVILRGRPAEVELQLNHSYAIIIEEYVVHPNDSFTLADNWNNGTTPPSCSMNVTVVQLMGKMVKVSGVGANEALWSGWLPRKSFRIEKEL